MSGTKPSFLKRLSLASIRSGSFVTLNGETVESGKKMIKALDNFEEEKMQKQRERLNSMVGNLRKENSESNLKLVAEAVVFLITKNCTIFLN